ncbi:hypothetical protein Micbo1qcDRAFT_235749 [Microdochium bolleyi]|uniref:DUF4396 domain-containing protein n=1 Tax=Microdochium bolleyi TaxID=196109 RepID=A0A136ITY1_9PEZI|nr:hypothetical protein Micbo1qcDRAFT_235749 [Microdochium bolleyi]
MLTRRVCQPAWGAFGGARPASIPALRVSRRHSCNKTISASPAHSNASSCHKSTATGPASPPVPPMTQFSFWTLRTAWSRASVNTLRCLVGCTAGDFSAMWTLQSVYPDLGVGTIMAASMAAGIASSMTLETVLLHSGKDKLAWAVAFRTAAGMSFISMLTMEAAENAVDYHLTGGVVAFDDPSFWLASVAAVAAGFLAPLPYNYFRLRKYSKACH